VSLPVSADDISDDLGGWRLAPRATACRDILRSLRSQTCDAETAAAELIAVATPAERENGMPRWLRAAHERLTEDPARARVDALAEEAGVHRVYFARLFDAKFGAPPSVVRRRAMLEHALAAIFERRLPLAEAAAAVGFADQAHMSRAFAEFIGVAPARLRALLQ
jgi:AraC-like DNA-binding protein